MTAIHYREGSFPPEDRIDWRALAPLIGQASAAVARYDGHLSSILNPRVLLAPLTIQEAVLSSRIEGTQATLGEVLEFEAGQPPASAARREDVVEILNYQQALIEAERMLGELPLCLRVVLDAHRILMSGARGANNAPGEFRRIQNWIGAPGSTIETATYVPISADRLPHAFARWERYLNDDTSDPLVQLAVLHAEFEALHPFLDGNGRLGRLLIPLFLWQRGFIRAPMFYISAFFEADRSAYYEGLLGVSRDDDWTGWCRFFLQAVQAQAEDNLARARGIIDLYDSLKSRVIDLTRSQYAIYALDWIFEQPIFRSTDFAEQAAIPAPSARRILKLLRDEDILKTLVEGGGRRPVTLIFPALLNVAEGKEPF